MPLLFLQISNTNEKWILLNLKVALFFGACASNTHVPAKFASFEKNDSHLCKDGSQTTD